MSDEKTEEPTQKKLDDAKEKGQAPKSQDLIAAASLGCMSIALMGGGSILYDRLSALAHQAIHEGLQVTSNDAMLTYAFDQAFSGLMTILPFIVLSIVIAIAASFAQTGLILTFEPLEPKFDKLNPAEGIKKLVGVRPMVDLAKMLAKGIALGWVLWILVKGLMPLAIGSAYLGLQGAGAIAWVSIIKLLLGATMVLIVIGPVDFGLQQWMFIRDNKMTKDEIKREYKESEGDPQLKGERKQLAKEMATSAPEKRVPGATVVVTNPTHYAVALYYQAGKTPLPVVVAKGVDGAAEHIKRIAAQHNVPIVGNPPLARALHKLRIDEPIPAPLFEAVAAVLRWVGDLPQLGQGFGTTTGKPTP